MQFDTAKIITTIKSMTKNPKLRTPEIVYMSSSIIPVSGKNTTFNFTTLGSTNALPSSLSPLFSDAAL